MDVKRNAVSGILLILLLMSFLTPAFNIQPVEAETRTWTVDDDLQDFPNADFTIIQDAVDAAIAGDLILVYPGTYIENVKINKDYLTIKAESGAEVTIVQAADQDDHVFGVTIDYVNIEGFTIEGVTGENKAGLYLGGVYHCNIKNNTLSNNYFGIRLDFSSNNTLISNIVSNNYVKPSYRSGGILLYHSTNNTLITNTANSNYGDGIYLYNSNNNTLACNVANSNGDYGIHLYASNYNTLINNTANSNVGGIHLVYFSNNNIFINNTADSNNYEGISLCGSSYNTLINNNASNNNLGICLEISNNNQIYLNDFINNVENVHYYDSTNIWNSPEEIIYTYKGKTCTNYLGNYWSDYTGSDADEDGIGDIPYIINRDDKDNYPLMEPFENYFVPTPPENQPPIVDIEPDLIYGVSSGEHVTFTGLNSYDPDGAIVAYEWDFGDGETATGILTSHRFRGAQNELRTYTVILKVEDDKGATAIDTCYVTVEPLEKTVEASHTIHIPPYLAYGRMTVTYNWIHENTYMVTKIHYKSDGFLGVGVISILDFQSYAVPMPIWSYNIFSFGYENERTYYPKLSQIQYGGDTFEGIVVDAFDVMNVNIVGWGGISISTEGPPLPNLFETSSACFEPDYTEVPEVPLEVLELYLAHLCSPGELRVYNSEGNITGLVNGEVKEDIPDSAYSDGTLIVFSLGGLYRYEVAGTGDGSYGLVVASILTGESNSFTATDIPTASGTIHQYTVDWDVLSLDKEGVTVLIDSDGNGFFEGFVSSDNELTYDEFMLQTPTTIDFDPDTLNLKSKGKWVTVYIELPEGYDVVDIDVSTVELFEGGNTIVNAELHPTEMGDYDDDGIADLMVKFDRQILIDYLKTIEFGEGDITELTVTGEAAGTRFEGFDTIQVISKGKR